MQIEMSVVHLWDPSKSYVNICRQFLVSHFFVHLENLFHTCSVALHRLLEWTEVLYSQSADTKVSVCVFADAGAVNLV